MKYATGIVILMLMIDLSHECIYYTHQSMWWNGLILKSWIQKTYRNLSTQWINFKSLDSSDACDGITQLIWSIPCPGSLSGWGLFWGGGHLSSIMWAGPLIFLCPPPPTWVVWKSHLFEFVILCCFLSTSLVPNHSHNNHNAHDEWYSKQICERNQSFATASTSHSASHKSFEPQLISTASGHRSPSWNTSFHIPDRVWPDFPNTRISSNVLSTLKILCFHMTGWWPSCLHS